MATGNPGLTYLTRFVGCLIIFLLICLRKTKKVPPQSINKENKDKPTFTFRIKVQCVFKMQGFFLKKCPNYFWDPLQRVHLQTECCFYRTTVIHISRFQNCRYTGFSFCFSPALISCLLHSVPLSSNLFPILLLLQPPANLVRFIYFMFLILAGKPGFHPLLIFFQLGFSLGISLASSLISVDKKKSRQFFHECL